MWNNQLQTQTPNSSPARRPDPPGSQNETSMMRPPSPGASTVACLPATIEFTGRISGQADLRIDGKVEGPISLQGHRLMVGPTGQLNSEVTANEVVVQGKVTGNLHARDRIEIKNGGSVSGDIHTCRISIEDGADFRGRAEIEPSRP
jgi:cytoskeletal protein CcmA (bactofilin family)